MQMRLKGGALGRVHAQLSPGVPQKAALLRSQSSQVAGLESTPSRLLVGGRLEGGESDHPPNTGGWISTGATMPLELHGVTFGVCGVRCFLSVHVQESWDQGGVLLFAADQ